MEVQVNHCSQEFVGSTGNSQELTWDVGWRWSLAVGRRWKLLLESPVASWNVMVVIGEVVGCDDEMKGRYSKNSVRGIRQWTEWIHSQSNKCKRERKDCPHQTWTKALIWRRLAGSGGDRKHNLLKDYLPSVSQHSTYFIDFYTSANPEEQSKALIMSLL